MKRSEKFWKIMTYLFCIAWTIFNVYAINTFIEYSKDINVEVIVRSKYAVGYSGKHSAGERTYLKAYSKKYGMLDIPVTPTTYEDSQIGETANFEISLRSIGNYSDKPNFSTELISIIGLMSSAVQALVILVAGLSMLPTAITAFNDYIDRK